MVQSRFNGALLRRLRKKGGLTLKSFAGEFYRQFDHYVTYQTIDLWEQGRSQPRGHHLVMLAAILGVEEVTFYEGEDIPLTETAQQGQI